MSRLISSEKSRYKSTVSRKHCRYLTAGELQLYRQSTSDLYATVSRLKTSKHQQRVANRAGGNLFIGFRVPTRLYKCGQREQPAIHF